MGNTPTPFLSGTEVVVVVDWAEVEVMFEGLGKCQLFRARASQSQSLRGLAGRVRIEPLSRPENSSVAAGLPLGRFGRAKHHCKRLSWKAR